jgi:Ras-related protein Rap-1B
MKSGQGFLLVFSITSMASLADIAELRDQIIRLKDDPYVPIVLVGNKSDLEENRAVSRSRAFAISQSWGNIPYYETSARRRANVDEVFTDLCRQVIRRENELLRYSGSDSRDGSRRYRRPAPRPPRARRNSRSKDRICTIL